MLPAIFHLCVGCHGVDGISSRDLTPSLASQPAAYVAAQLTLFRKTQRKVEVMQFVANQLSARDVLALGAALEKLPPPPAAAAVDKSIYERGKRVAEREQCGTCHQPDFSGIETAPRLANQREDYLMKALTDFRQGSRIGYGEPVMPAVAKALSEAEIRDLAHYLAHVRPPP